MANIIFANIIRINNPEDIFNEKKKVIIRLNEFIKLYAEVNNIEQKLRKYEVRNLNGQFIELYALQLEPVDQNLVWIRFYRNQFIPTLDSLLYDSVFPSQQTIDIFNAEWKRIKQHYDETVTISINSTDRSKSFVW
jgi:hypothetical protein